MAFYKSPLQPFDPVVQDDPQGHAKRYIRDNFNGTGQDSYTQFPAQDQAQWQALSNVMPITKGILFYRWGTVLQSTLSSTNAFIRAAMYQNDITPSRNVVLSSAGKVVALNEDGTTFNSSVYTPTAAPRMTVSRNYGYFVSGVAGDLQKWDGTSNATTNWGIASPAQNTSGSTSSKYAGTAGNLFGVNWTNKNNATGAPDGSFATTTMSSGGTGGRLSADILLTNFGFGISSSATILGITVNVTGKYSGGTGASGDGGTWVGYLTKDAATVYGQARNGPPGALSTSSTVVSMGGSADLWGPSNTFIAADLNSSNFGIAIQGYNYGPLSSTETFYIDAVQVTVTYTTVSGAISVAVGGAGTVTLSVGRGYYCVYKNGTTGHLSDLNVFSGSSGPCASSVLNLTTIPVSSDSQVTSKILLATADGADPSVLYFLAEVAASATTYTDNTPETTLELNQIYAYTDTFGNQFGVVFNQPPPTTITLACKHKGRIYAAAGENLYFSKNVNELTVPNGLVTGKYEEAWPPQNYFDVSNGAELVSGLLSDGNVLYIGTQSHIRRLLGDSPNNFQVPEIVHPNVGVLNQEVWQTVFMQGTPVGFMWVTPDYRVVLSDGNTYMDVGVPIQDVLNNQRISASQTTVQSGMHAMFVSSGEYDLYILGGFSGGNSGPGCDLHWAFDLKSHQWFPWSPPENSRAMVFNVSIGGVPQWWWVGDISAGTSHIWQYQSSATRDKQGLSPVGINASATTSWLHFGMPTHHKILDELEVDIDTGGSNSLVTITARNSFSLGGIQTIFSAAPKAGYFNTYKCFNTQPSNPGSFKYYQLQFSNNNSIAGNPIVNSWNARVVPWHTL